jgi:hypothetical protein
LFSTGAIPKPPHHRNLGWQIGRSPQPKPQLATWGAPPAHLGMDLGQPESPPWFQNLQKICSTSLHTHFTAPPSISTTMSIQVTDDSLLSTALLFNDREQHRNAGQRRRRRTSALIALLLMRERLRAGNLANRITTECLLEPEHTAWPHFYQNASNSNFIAFTTIDKASFELLLRHFNEEYIVKSGTGLPGRPAKLLEKHMVLGMILHFYADTMSQKSLCVTFGVPPATMSRILRKAEIALGRSLKRIPDATIRWPSKDQQRSWAEAIAAREPLIKKKWGFIDGKNLSVQKPGSSDLQNAMYNGWLHATLITGTICFGADGAIVWVTHNLPGSWNDGETSRLFRETLLDEERSLQDHGVLADSAFPSSGAMFNRIITPLKDGELEKCSPETRTGLLAMNNAIVSVRQAVEWGMGSIEKPYRRLTIPFPFNPEVRAVRLSNIFRLYNFRVRRTGISQIRSIFLGNRE